MTWVKRVGKAVGLVSATVAVVVIQAELLPNAPVNPTSDVAVAEPAPTPTATPDQTATGAAVPAATSPATETAGVGTATGSTAVNRPAANPGGPGPSNPTPPPNTPLEQVCTGLVGGVPLVGDGCRAL